jgi:hypothetical protein
MKKLLIAAAIIFCATGLAQATVIDDFTQDRSFDMGRGTLTYPATLTDSRIDTTNTHIIGGRCDITLNLYAGDGFNPDLNFFVGSEAYESICYDYDENYDPINPHPCTIPAYPAAVSYNSNFSSSGDWTLEYGKSADLNKNLTCTGVNAIKIDFDGDMYGGGSASSCSNPDPVYGCPRPVPVTMAIISKKGTPQQATASKTINLVNPIQTPATASFNFSDFPGIDFTDVDYIKLKFDNVVKNAVDYSLFKIYTDCSPTVIELSSLTAKASNGRVKLEWVTESEIDNAGFNIWRAEAENGTYVKLNDEIISAKGSATKGAKYVFTDNIAKNRKTFFYKLEDVDLAGVGTLHGPVSATPKFLLGIFNK